VAKQQGDSGLNDKQDKTQKEKMPASPCHGMPNTRSTMHFLKNGENLENLIDLSTKPLLRGRI
jgi:hypothetical protein